jgi:hypothetical protein
MKNLSFLMPFLVVAFLLTACTGENPIAPNPDQPTVHYKKKHPVPFTANISTLSGPVLVDRCGAENPDLYTLYHEGSGNAKHMGKIFASTTFCQSYSNIAVTLDAQWEFVAANGDLLFLHVPLTVMDFTNWPTEVEGNGEFVITGGTGRFEDATGEGTVHWTRLLVPSGEPVIATFDGEIMY